MTHQTILELAIRLPAGFLSGLSITLPFWRERWGVK